MALSDSEAYREGGFKDFGAFSGEPHKKKTEQHFCNVLTDMHTRTTMCLKI